MTFILGAVLRKAFFSSPCQDQMNIHLKVHLILVCVCVCTCACVYRCSCIHPKINPEFVLSLYPSWFLRQSLSLASAEIV